MSSNDGNGATRNNFGSSVATVGDESAVEATTSNDPTYRPPAPPPESPGPVDRGQTPLRKVSATDKRPRPGDRQAAPSPNTRPATEEDDESPDDDANNADSPEKDAPSGDEDQDDQGSEEGDAKRQSKADKGQSKKKKPERTPLYKRLWFWIVVAVVLVLAGVGVLLWWLDARHYESTDDAYIDAHPVRLASQVAGRVNRVMVRDNDLVEAGQVLVRLDPADYQARLEQAQAQVVGAQAMVEQNRAQRLVAEANAEQAQADVQVAQADADRAQADNQRYTELQKTSPGAVSKQQLDTSRTSAQSATAQLNAAKKKAAAADAQVKLAATMIQNAQAQVTAAQASVDEAKLQSDYTTLTASKAGRITEMQVSLGDYITPGRSLLMIVPTEIWVVANFKETDITDIHPGQPVTISVDAYPDHEFTGKVDSLQRGSGVAFSILPPQNATGNWVKVVQRVPVKITFDRLPDKDFALGPGMSVQPRIKVR